MRTRAWSTLKKYPWGRLNEIPKRTSPTSRSSWPLSTPEAVLLPGSWTLMPVPTGSVDVTNGSKICSPREGAEAAEEAEAGAVGAVGRVAEVRPSNAARQVQYLLMRIQRIQSIFWARPWVPAREKLDANFLGVSGEPSPAWKPFTRYLKLKDARDVRDASRVYCKESSWTGDVQRVDQVFPMIFSWLCSLTLGPQKKDMVTSSPQQVREKKKRASSVDKACPDAWHGCGLF